MAKGLPRSGKKGGASAPLMRIEKPLDGLSIAITDPGGANGYGNADSKLRFPEGNILILGMLAYCQFFSVSAGLTAGWSGAVALGTSATSDATINGNEINLLPLTTLNAATAKLSPIVKMASSSSINGTIIDNTNNDVVPYLNFSIDDATLSAGSTLTAKGFIIALVSVLGDD